MATAVELLKIYATLEARDQGVSAAIQRMRQAFQGVTFDVGRARAAYAEYARQEAAAFKQQEAAAKQAAQAAQQNAQTAASAYMSVTGALVSYAREAVGYLMQAESVEDRLTRVTVAFGNAAGFSASQLKRMAEEGAKGTPFTKYQMEEAETQLSRFTEVRGAQFRKALEAAKSMSYATGIDPAQAARMLGIVLEDPSRGSHLLRRTLGITYTDQEHRRMEALTKGGRIEEAQDIALNKIPNIEAPQTLQSQLQMLRKEMMYFGASIGEDLAKSVREFLGWMQGLTSWLRQLSPEMRENIVFFLKLAVAAYGLGKAIQLAALAGRDIKAALATLSAHPLLVLAAAAALLSMRLLEAVKSSGDLAERNRGLFHEAAFEDYGNIKDPKERAKKAAQELKELSKDIEQRGKERDQMWPWQKVSIDNPFAGEHGDKLVDTEGARMGRMLEWAERRRNSLLRIINEANKQGEGPPERQQQRTGPVHSVGFADSWMKIQESILEAATGDPVQKEVEKSNDLLQQMLDWMQKLGNLFPQAPPMPRPGG